LIDASLIVIIYLQKNIAYHNTKLLAVIGNITLLLTGKAPAIYSVTYTNPFVRQFSNQSRVQTALGYHPHDRLAVLWLLLAGQSRLASA